MTDQQNQNATATDRPNIILMLVDQLAAKWLEAAESGICELANIKWLKDHGTSFRNAYSSNPICMPARATIATGLSSRGHGVLENGYRLDPSLPTFMQALQNAGWRTGAFGKLHYNPMSCGLIHDDKPYGFDVTRITDDSRGGEWLDWVREEHQEHFEAVLATVWASNLPGFKSYGPSGEDLQSRIKRIRSSFTWDPGGYPYSSPMCHALPFPEEISQTDWITSHAIDFIGNTDASRPLFAQISYVQPHSPFCAPRQYLDQVDTESIPHPIEPGWQQDANAPQLFRDRPLPFQQLQPTEAWSFARQLYFADLAHLDRQLGKILNALRQSGGLDETFLVFASDHGEMLCDHGILGKGPYHYDACIRVPFIVAGPGLASGQESDAMVLLEDICPTILDMAGQQMPPLPAQPGRPRQLEESSLVHGRSLLPLCRRLAPSDWRQAAYIESYSTVYSLTPAHWARTIRTPRYRYSYYPERSEEQLFDLAEDPDESENRIADQSLASVTGELRRELVERLILQDTPHPRRDLVSLGWF